MKHGKDFGTLAQKAWTFLRTLNGPKKIVNKAIKTDDFEFSFEGTQTASTDTLGERPSA